MKTVLVAVQEVEQSELEKPNKKQTPHNLVFNVLIKIILRF